MANRLDGLKVQVWSYVEEPDEHSRSQILQSIAHLEGALQSMRADYEAADTTEGEPVADDQPPPRPDPRDGEPEAR